MRILSFAILISLTLSAPQVASTRAPARAKPTPGIVEERIDVPLFGKVKVYRPELIEKTHGLALFVSGDGGFDLGVVDMARRLASRTVVVGLPMNSWRKIAEKASGSCWYPAGDIETIAQVVEKRYGFPRYVPPVLVGYSSGATLVYGILAQAPPESFAGAVSLGFCADLEVARTFCGKGDWKPTYDLKKHKSWLPARAPFIPGPGGGPRWIALQGQIDQVCDPKEVTEFATKVQNARVVPLEKVGHGFSVPKNWGQAFDEAVASFLDLLTPWQPLPRRERSADAATPSEVEAKLDALDLPLEVLWPEGASAVVIFVSGDGGWAELDQEIAKGLERQGIAVVGWNTLRYFWRAKTPEAFRADLARVVDALPEEIAVFAGGYSFGAEVVAVTLAEKPLPRMRGLVLVGPGPYATFEVSPLDWFRESASPSPHSVRGGLENPGVAVLCLQSSSETDSGCPAESRSEVTVVRIPGGHHFGGDFEGLAARISAFVDARSA